MNEDDWEYKRAKILREKEKYKGRKIVDGKSLFVVHKSKREMKPITCKYKTPMFSCSALLEDDRKCLFTKFWSMNWNQKKIFMGGLTEVNLTERARDRKEESRRKFSSKFYLNINNKKLRVCRKTFLDTYDLKGWTVNQWLKEKTGDDENALIEDEDNGDKTSGNVIVEQKSGMPTRQEQLNKTLTV